MNSPYGACFHIAGVTCDNCRHLMQPSAPVQQTVTSTTLIFTSAPLQEIQDRAFVEGLCALLRKYPDLRERLRAVLEEKP